MGSLLREEGTNSTQSFLSRDNYDVILQKLPERALFVAREQLRPNQRFIHAKTKIARAADNVNDIYQRYDLVIHILLRHESP